MFLKIVVVVGQNYARIHRLDRDFLSASVVCINIVKYYIFVDIEMLDLKGKMRTQSRHSMVHRFCLCNSSIRLLALGYCFVLCHQAAAGPISDRLQQYVAQDLGAVIASFGQPNTQSANHLTYSFNAGQSPMNLGQHRNFGPVPSIDPADPHGFVTPDNADFPQPPLPCFLEFHLSPESTVESVNYRGPGCFEVVLGRTVPKH